MKATTTKSSNAASVRKTPIRRKRATPAIPSQELIAETAYHLAEKRGFVPGSELQDWFEAERIIQERFSQT